METARAQRRSRSCACALQPTGDASGLAGTRAVKLYKSHRAGKQDCVYDKKLETNLWLNCK